MRLDAGKFFIVLLLLHLTVSSQLLFLMRLDAGKFFIVLLLLHLTVSSQLLSSFFNLCYKTLLTNIRVTNIIILYVCIMTSLHYII